MVADDDLYWLDPVVGAPSQPGANDFFEATNVKRLETAGADKFEIRFFETNHAEHLLHHNKYVIYRTSTGKAFGLIAGAANLTGANLSDADLTGANVVTAHLNNAKVDGTNFTDANLSNAVFTGAVTTGAIWSNTTCPDGSLSNTNGSNPESCVGHGGGL